mmetsp:Transcript_977/g.2632  ORF Transcript_977/g.2632 Transcript_977/m.2632 type:complete len:229 (+) Transcript_977:763-1449(+)
MLEKRPCPSACFDVTNACCVVGRYEKRSALVDFASEMSCGIGLICSRCSSCVSWIDFRRLTANSISTGHASAAEPSCRKKERAGESGNASPRTTCSIVSSVSSEGGACGAGSCGFVRWVNTTFCPCASNDCSSTIGECFWLATVFIRPSCETCETSSWLSDESLTSMPDSLTPVLSASLRVRKFFGLPTVYEGSPSDQFIAEFPSTTDAPKPYAMVAQPSSVVVCSRG